MPSFAGCPKKSLWWNFEIFNPTNVTIDLNTKSEIAPINERWQFLFWSNQLEPIVAKSHISLTGVFRHPVCVKLKAKLVFNDIVTSVG